MTNKQWREDMSILEVSKWKISQRLQKAEQTIRTLQSEVIFPLLVVEYREFSVPRRYYEFPHQDGCSGRHLFVLSSTT